ncbi:MAG TPA: alpha/beta hydrolase [Bryobacteraceae bacterium]|nr:alpha/beta hydrolase [Bryobacteraceae bacterium]
MLQRAGLATLLMDLLTPDEDRQDRITAHLRFNIGLLAERLLGAASWLQSEPATRNLRIGCFGASTGAGAALVAAASRGNPIGAVVSRGGRPDLAGDALARVEIPVLLIVGANDGIVIELNRGALEQLPGEKKLEIIPGAGHLFEEPGTLEQVADLASKWPNSQLAVPQS